MLFAARVLVCVLAPLAGSLRTEQAEGECETTTVPAQTEACFEKRPAWSDSRGLDGSGRDAHEESLAAPR